MVHEVYLLLGTNLGEKEANLAQAIAWIGSELGQIKKKSSIYESGPWGNTNQPDFLNQIVMVKTKTAPEKVLDIVLHVEQMMGRKRLIPWGERIIDIDILFYGTQIIHKLNLTIPHPAIPSRRFTLVPLNEIASGFVHPILRKSVGQLLKEGKDSLPVVLID